MAEGRRQRLRPARYPGPPERAHPAARALRAAGRHRRAPEPAAQRGRVERLPGRGSHRAERRRARAAGADRRRRAAHRRLAAAAGRGRGRAAAGHPALAGRSAAHPAGPPAPRPRRRRRRGAALLPGGAADRAAPGAGLPVCRHRRRVRPLPRRRPRPAGHAGRAGRGGAGQPARQRRAGGQGGRAHRAARAARRRAGADQQHPAGHGRRAGLPGHRRPGRRHAERGLHRARRVDLLVGRRGRPEPLPVRAAARPARQHRSRCGPTPTGRIAKAFCARPAGGGQQPRRDGRAGACARVPGHASRACPPRWCRSSAATGCIGTHRARRPRARERLRRGRGAAAQHRGREHGRGAGERAPVRRDAAPAEGDRAAQRRAGGDQQHPAGHGGAARASRPSSTWWATSCARCSTSDDIGIAWHDAPAQPAALRATACEHGAAAAAPTDAGGAGRSPSRAWRSRAGRRCCNNRGGAAMAAGILHDAGHRTTACRWSWCRSSAATACWASSASKTTSARTPSARPRCAC